MIQCPECSCRTNIVKNGFKRLSNVQNYLCKNCNRQFIDRKYLKYKKHDNDKSLDEVIARFLERGSGVRDIQFGLKVSRTRVLKVLANFQLKITPKLKKYKSIQIDELWSYVKNKKNKKWMIYAYSKETKEILASIFGRRDVSTVRRLYAKIKSLNVEIQEYCTDTWNSFIKVFSQENHKIGKQYTKDIEGVNCLLRHRISRLVRRTCCFSKKLNYHINAIGLVVGASKLIQIQIIGNNFVFFESQK